VTFPLVAAEGSTSMPRRLIGMNAKGAVGAATVALLAALAAGSVAFARPQAATVAVTAGKPSELRFTLSKRTVPRGVVTFNVTNRGKLDHDFRIAGKKTARLAPGKRAAALRVTLNKAGRFAFLCTVPGHAAGGMKGTLVVR
jgi:uncharacterized cupredoxin-like copper-binding protein